MGQVKAIRSGWRNNYLAGFAIALCLSLSVKGAVAAPRPANAPAEVIALSANVGGTVIPVYLHMPAGAGPFPLLVMSHGSPRDAERRSRLGANTLAEQAQAYTQKGVAVAVPIRRGYGGNGAWAENYGGCAAGNYGPAGLASAADIRAAMNIAKAQPGIDAGRVVLLGHSAGAFGSVAAGGTGGIKGVVAFAAGRGSRGPNDVCQEDKLVAAMGRYGAAARAPQLWVYAENDLFFGPALAKRLYEAFTKAGGRATFVAAPAYGFDGHDYFRAVSSWQPTVDSFLKRVGFFR